MISHVLILLFLERCGSEDTLIHCDGVEGDCSKLLSQKLILLQISRGDGVKPTTVILSQFVDAALPKRYIRNFLGKLRNYIHSPVPFPQPHSLLDSKLLTAIYYVRANRSETGIYIFAMND